MDRPSELEPALIECPECGGAGCDECGGQGEFELTECPQAYAAEMAEVLHYAVMYEKGLPPVAGGTLEQTHWFTTACGQIWADEGQLKPRGLAL